MTQAAGTSSRKNIDGFKAWQQKVAAEEAAAKAKAEEEARAAGKNDVNMESPGAGGGQNARANPSKRTMQQEEVDGAAIKLEEAIKAETMSPEDFQAVVEAARKRLSKKMRVG